MQRPIDINLYTRSQLRDLLGIGGTTVRERLDDFNIGPTLSKAGVNYYDDSALHKLRLITDLRDRGVSKALIQSTLDRLDLTSEKYDLEQVLSKIKEIEVAGIPTAKAIQLPYLQVLSDGVERTASEINAKLIEFFQLTERELYQRVSDGKETVFAKNARTARHNLMKANLVELTQKYGREGAYKITLSGVARLNESTTNIDEFLEVSSSVPDELLPEDIIEQQYKEHRKELAKVLLHKVKANNDKFFENLCKDLLTGMGYGVGEVTGSNSGDGGLDGVIFEDKLGLDRVYYQAKRWTEKTVGQPDLRDFVGALEAKGAVKGVFITTSSFSDPAKAYVEALQTKKIVLIDGDRLGELMIDYDIGVSTKKIYQLKEDDTDYFTIDK